MFGAVGAPYPKEPVEPYPGGGGADGVESILGVHQRAGVLPPCGFGQNGKQQAGTAGRSGAMDFREAAARQAAGGRIHFRDSRANHFGRREGLPLQCSAERRFELPPEGRPAHIRLFFAFNYIFTG